MYDLVCYSLYPQDPFNTAHSAGRLLYELCNGLAPHKVLRSSEVEHCIKESKDLIVTQIFFYFTLMTKRLTLFKWYETKLLIYPWFSAAFVGHGSTLHCSDSIAGPSLSQLWPPLSGAGLVHSRVLWRTPPPHVTVHLPNSVHSE